MRKSISFALAMLLLIIFLGFNLNESWAESIPKPSIPQATASELGYIFGPPFTCLMFNVTIKNEPLYFNFNGNDSSIKYTVHYKEHSEVNWSGNVSAGQSDSEYTSVYVMIRVNSSDVHEIDWQVRADLGYYYNETVGGGHSPGYVPSPNPAIRPSDPNYLDYILSLYNGRTYTFFETVESSDWSSTATTALPYPLPPFPTVLPRFDPSKTLTSPSPIHIGPFTTPKAESITLPTIPMSVSVVLLTFLLCAVLLIVYARLRHKENISNKS